MNKLKGKIIEAITVDQFTKVKLEVADEIFVSIVITVADINPSLTVGDFVHFLFKETDITLSLDMPKLISITNKIPVVISAKEMGVILSRIIVDFKGHLISAVVPTDFAAQFKITDNIVMLVRSNEIMLLD